MLREDADDAVLRLLARVAPGAEEARAALRSAVGVHPVRVRVGAERAIEDLGLHGARDDVDRRGDAALAPVRAQALAQDDEPVALVVDAREEALERALQREMNARLQEVVLRELLREEDVVGRRTGASC